VGRIRWDLMMERWSLLTLKEYISIVSYINAMNAFLFLMCK
jgi:hypothetical protein